MSFSSFKLPNGDRYIGEFNENGLKHGIGEYNWTNKHVNYKGNWENDQMNGKGMIVYKNGDLYQGEFLNNKFHGEGEYFWKDSSSSVKGKFSDGELEGFAIYNASDDQVWEGKFYAKQGATGLSFRLIEKGL